MNAKQKTPAKSTSKKTQKKTPLFRAEAIRHRTRALFGDVVLAAPLSTWLITGLLAVIIVGLFMVGFFGTVQVDNENISIWRWLWGGEK